MSLSGESSPGAENSRTFLITASQSASLVRFLDASRRSFKPTPANCSPPPLKVSSTQSVYGMIVSPPLARRCPRGVDGFPEAHAPRTNFLDLAGAAQTDHGYMLGGEQKGQAHKRECQGSGIAPHDPRPSRIVDEKGKKGRAALRAGRKTGELAGSPLSLRERAVSAEQRDKKQ